MKIKSLIYRILAIAISLLLIGISMASAKEKVNVSPDQLREMTYKSDWYSNNYVPSLVGKKLTNIAALYDKKGAYCLAENTSVSSAKAGWIVDSVIDINNNEIGGGGKVIVHSQSGTETYNVSEAGSNEGVRQLLRLGFVTRVATENNETSIVLGSGIGPAKCAMATMFANRNILNALKDVNVATGMTSKTSNANMKNDPSVAKVLDSATKAANNQAVKLTTTQTTEEKEKKEYEKRSHQSDGQVIILDGVAYYGTCVCYPENMVNKYHYRIGVSTTSEEKITSSKQCDLFTSKIIYEKDYRDGRLDKVIDIKDYEPGRLYYAVFEGDAAKKLAKCKLEHIYCIWCVKAKETTVTTDTPSTVDNQASGYLKDTTLKPDEITTDIINGKTYIGPYRITYMDCSPYQIEITTTKQTYTTSQISYDEKTSTDIRKIEKNKDFYIVVDKEIEDEIKKITVTADGVTQNKSRIVILQGDLSQDFIVYKSEEDKNGKTSVDLPLPKFVTLDIQKEDEFPNANISLKGIGFKVYCENRGWVKIDDKRVVFQETFDQAQTFYTDEKGYVYVSNKLPVGTYKVYETELTEEQNLIYDLSEIEVPKKSGGTEIRKAIPTESKKILAGQKATVSAKNHRAFTELQIEKKDFDTGKKLSGIGFKIYSQNKGNEGWVIVDQNNVVQEPFTDDFYKATEIVTAEGGLTPIIKRLRLGTYAIIETNLGEYEKYYDLGTIKIGENTYNGNLIKTITLKANEQGKVTVDIENPQTKVKISGFVWEELVEGKGLQTRESKEYTAEKDKKIEGIQVWLINTKTNKVEQRTHTNAKGEYTFEKVRIREERNPEKELKEDEIPERNYLDNYKVQFTYDGITYQDVISDYEELKKYEDDKKTVINEKSCKALEDTELRNALNEDFTELNGKGQVIQESKARARINEILNLYNENTIEKIITLNYTRKEIENRYTTTYDVNLENICKREEIEEHIRMGNDRTIGDFPVVAKTPDSLLQEYLNAIAPKDDLLYEITNINLGLDLRERPNLILDKDIYVAERHINSQTAYTPANTKLLREPIKTNTGVLYDGTSQAIYEADIKGEDEVNNPKFYSLPIDRADIADADYDVTVWYKIKLLNATTNYYATVNSINESFSEDYEFIPDENGKPIVYIGGELDSLKEHYNNLIGDKLEQVRIKEEIKYENDVTDNEGKKRKVSKWIFAEPIKLSSSIDNNNNNIEYLYIPLHIKDIKKYCKDTWKYDTKSKSFLDNTSGLQNFVEIGSYSIYSDENYSKHYAGVDSTSIPSNFDFKTNDKMEDDESQAPGLRLLDVGVRTIEGNVFEDLPDKETGTNKERIGNGKLDDGETGIEGVKVEIYQIGEDEAGNRTETLFTPKRVNETSGDLDGIDENYVTTDEKGNYKIEGLQVANYFIRFTWGNDDYDVKDYKGTIFNKDPDRLNNVNWVQDEYKEENEVRLSDAIDDYDTRKRIDEKARKYEDYDNEMQSTTPDFKIDIDKYEEPERAGESSKVYKDNHEFLEKEIEGNNYICLGSMSVTQDFINEKGGKIPGVTYYCISKYLEGYKEKKYSNDKVKEIEEHSEYNKYKAIGVAYLDDDKNISKFVKFEDAPITKPNKQYYIVFEENNNMLNNVKTAVKNYCYYNPVPAEERKAIEVNYSKIDFGIIERPVQSLSIDKKLSQIELVTTQGQPIASAKVKDDTGELDITAGNDYITGNRNLGYIWIQLDKSITQSMTANMKYNIEVQNTSEIDYDYEDYYKYGTIPDEKKEENLIRLGTEAVYDYAKGASISSNESSDWGITSIDKYQAVPKTITENKYTSSYTEEADGTINWKTKDEKVIWNTNMEEEKIIFDRWYNENGSEYVRNIKLKNREIIKCNNGDLSNFIKPGENIPLVLNTAKMLANGDNVEFYNDAEITNEKYDFNKMTGRRLVVEKSQCYDEAEKIMITPATGDDKNFTPIIIVSIAVMATLAIGIIIIKKTVLK